MATVNERLQAIKILYGYNKALGEDVSRAWGKGKLFRADGLPIPQKYRVLIERNQPTGRGERFVDQVPQNSPPLNKIGYADNWAEISRSIRDRDGNCQRCGSLNQLGVHHVDTNKANNSPDNLVTYCWPCHRAVHWEIARKRKGCGDEQGT